MRRAFLLLAAASLSACAAEVPPRVDPAKIEAAAEHAQVEMERATSAAPARGSRTSK
jgi:hypothetical protein